uniref:Uncharacterized protein n=1 Tax=Anopheles dirus TaxID=7168 RepID=A0A182N9K0_9DIPT
MDLSGSFSGDELIPDSCLESEWTDEDEVFAILKQWETRGGRGNNKTVGAAAPATVWCNPGGSSSSNSTFGAGHILLNQSISNEGNSGSGIPGKLEETLNNKQDLFEHLTDYDTKEHLLDDIDSVLSEKRLPNANSSTQKFVDTGTFTRPKRRNETNLLNNTSTLSVENNASTSSHPEFVIGGSPLLNVQIGGPVTPSALATSALATSATGNRLLMQRSWLNDVSPPCSIMNSMEYSANDKITSSLITSGDFSNVGCLLNAGDESGVGGNASYNGYNLYSVIEDRQRLENLCLDDESTLTKDCNISRTDLNAIESVSGVSTMQNSYESGGGGRVATAAAMGGSSCRSSFEEESPSVADKEDSEKVPADATIVTATVATDETFHLPMAPGPPEPVPDKTQNGGGGGGVGGTYDMRRPRNFHTYRKPRSSINQTFEEMARDGGVDEPDPDTAIDPPISEQTFDGQAPMVAPALNGAKYAVMNSTFGIVDNEQLGGGGGVGNGYKTFVRNRTPNKGNDDNVRLLNLTQDGEDTGAAITPPPAVPYGRTFKRCPRNGTFTGGELDDMMRQLPLDSPLRPTVVSATSSADTDARLQDEEPASPVGQRTPNGTFSGQHQQQHENSMLVQSTPFHGPFTRTKPAPEIPDISPIGTDGVNKTTGSGLGRTMIRRSRNLEHDLQNATYDGRPEDLAPAREEDEPAGDDVMLDLETDDFDVQIRRLPPPASATNATTTGPDISNFLDAEKRISLQHFEEFEKSILESEHSGIDFDEMLNSLTADVRRSDEASDKLRQSLDNIKKRHSRINLEKQQQDEMKRKLHQQQQPTAATLLVEAQPDNRLADSLLSKSGGSMCSSGGSERLLNRRSRYNEDVQLTLSPQQQHLATTTVTMPNRGSELPEESDDPVPTEQKEVETYDRKNRDRFKTIRLGRKRDDSQAPAGKVEHGEDGIDDETVFKKPQVLSAQPASGLVRPGDSRLRSTLSKPRYYGGPVPVQSVTGIQRKDLTLPLSGKSSSTDCLEQRGEDPYLLQHQLQQQQIGKSLQQPTSRLATMSKLGGGSGGLLGTGRNSQFGLANKQLQLQQHQPNTQQPPGGVPTLKSPMGTKSKSYHSLTFAQANGNSGYGGSSGNLSKLHGSSAMQLKLKHNSSNTELKSNTFKRSSLQQQAVSNLRTSASGGYHHQQGVGAGVGLGGRASLPLVRSPAAQPHAARTDPTTSSTAAAMANKNALNATTTLSGTGVQMRTASGMAKTSRLGLVRPSSGYFSYNTHRKHPDSDNESVNSLSSSSASSRGSLYRVDSQSIANTVQPQPFMSATRTNSIEDLSGANSSGGMGNGLLTKLNGTGAGSGPGVLSAYASIEPPLPKTSSGASSATGLKQPQTAATGVGKPSGLRPPSAIRPPTVRSGLPRPTSYIRR